MADQDNIPEEEITQSPQSATAENAVNSDSLQLEPDVEQNLAARVDKDFSTSDTARTKWLAKKKEGLKLYWGQLPEKSFPFKNSANVNVPLIRTIAETVHANIHGSFDYKTPFDVLPQGPEDAVKARRTKKFLNWQFTSQVDFSSLIDHMVNFCLLYGHAPVKVRYSQKVDSGEETENGLSVDVLNPESILFPADAQTADPNSPLMDFIIHEIPMNASDIRRRVASGQYKDVDLGKPNNSSGPSDTQLRDIRDIHIGLNTSDAGQAHRGKSNRMFKVLEWYGYYDIDGDGIEESVMVAYLPDQKEILRVVRWDISRPFVIVRWSPIFNTPWGESVPDILGKLNEELNTLHNQRVDAVTLSNVPYGFFDPMAGVKMDAIQIYPGLMIPTQGNPSQAVYFPPMQPVKPEMYREEELIMSYAERLLGAGANAQGGINPRRLSATEVATVDRRSGIRFFTIFKRIQRGVSQVGRLALELDRLLMPEEKQIRIMGANDSPIMETQVSFDRFRKEELDGKFDVTPNGRSIIDENADKEEQLTQYQLLIANPLTATNPEKLYNLSFDTLSKLGNTNPAAYLTKPLAQVPQDPDEENSRMAQGERIKPVLGENIEGHLESHMEFINSQQFQLIPPEGQEIAMRHLADTIQLKRALEVQQKLAQAQVAAAPTPPPEEDGNQPSR